MSRRQLFTGGTLQQRRAAARKKAADHAKWFREGYGAGAGATCPYKTNKAAAFHWNRGHDKWLDFKG